MFYPFSGSGSTNVLLLDREPLSSNSTQGVFDVPSNVVPIQKIYPQWFASTPSSISFNHMVCSLH